LRKRFSEKYGFKKVRDTFQVDNIDEDLKNRLWSQFRIYYMDNIPCSYDASIKNRDDYKLFINLYANFFKTSTKPTDFLSTLIKNIKKFFLQMRWYEVYDFIEYIPNTYHNEETNIKFKESVNSVLESEMSAYRFVGNYIVPIINEVEIKSIEETLECEYKPVKKHLSNALELLSNRENPDYQNSIKESITAVESISKIITGKETDLASCLKTMNLNLNKQFKTSMINLYGWTCKEDGIRHGHTKDELKTSFEEAKYMLVNCSAFINYLIAKNKESSLK
jgi:hypothetical protein